MNDRFLQMIFSGSGKNEHTLSESIAARNIHLIPIAALVVSCVSVYWFVVDLLSPSYNLEGIARLGVVLQLGTSIFMLFLPKLVRKSRLDGPFVRICFVLYFVILILGVGALTYTRNQGIVASGDINPYIGVSVAAFYLFILAFFPLYGKLDSFIVIITMYIGLVLPEIVMTTSTYSLMSHIILSVCFTAVYICFRRVTIESANHELEADHLSEKLLDESVVDALTGILNRRAMDEYIRHLLRNSHENYIGVAFFDIDFFKKYNDYYGHVEGDDVLQKIGEIAAKAISYLDNAYVFRYGGEEFTVIIEGATEEMLIEAMCRIRQAVFDAEMFREDIRAFDRVTVTVGGAIESLPNSTGDYMIAADNQLFIGKNNCRNCVYFMSRNVETGAETVGESEVPETLQPVPTDSRAEVADEKKRFESTFESAIENREFLAWCQPRYNTFTGEIIGAEALVHWKTENGQLTPDEFIPAFEANGLIVRLDEYIFRSVCFAQRNSLDRNQLTLPIAVNVSRTTLFSPGTFARFKEILDEYQIPAELVPLEITESSAVTGENLKRYANKLHEAGFKLLLDGFGTGYSSLSDLSVLPFDVIKIDRVLTNCIGSKVGEEVLRHTIELAHFLKKGIIAEGVESNEQLAFLRKLNCDAVQGFFLSRPVPYEDYKKLLAKAAKTAAAKPRDSAELADEAALAALKVTGDVKLQYLSALAGIYMSMHVIDLRDNTVTEFTTTTNIKEHVTKAHGADVQMAAAMKATVSPEYIDRVLEFCDIHTLAERMRGKRTIQMDFVGIHFGWTRAQFVVVSSNEQDEPEQVIYTTQVIEANKRKDEQVEVCITDELTGVFNQIAFDSDLPGFQDTLKWRKKGQFSILCADVKQLKETRQQLGSVAGDELLWGLADCLSKTFGKLGKVYRLKSDSFVVLFSAGVEDIREMRREFDELVSSWIGNNVRNLRVSYGIANAGEFHSISPKALLEEAKKRA